MGRLMLSVKAFIVFLLISVAFPLRATPPLYVPTGSPSSSPEAAQGPANSPGTCRLTVKVKDFDHNDRDAPDLPSGFWVVHWDLCNYCPTELPESSPLVYTYKLSETYKDGTPFSSVERYQGTTEGLHPGACESHGADLMRSDHGRTRYYLDDLKLSVEAREFTKADQNR